MKPDPKKVQGIIDLGQPTTTTEAQALTGMVQYYGDMWTRRSHLLAPLTEADSGPNSRAIIWNDYMEVFFKDLKLMVSKETLLNDHDWKIPFTIHTYSTDKKLIYVNSKNDKPIAFISKKLSKTQRSYTATEKEVLLIV